MDTDQLKNTATNLSTGNKILAGAGVAALVAAFLPWYSIDGGFGVSVNFAGRQFTFGWMGMVLLVGAAALVLAPKFGAKAVQTDTLRTEQIALGAAGVGTLLWLIRLISIPGVNAFNVVGRSFGLFVAIAAAAGVVFGIVTSMKEEGIAMPTAADFKSATSGLTTSSDAPAAPVPAPPVPAAPQAPVAPIAQAAPAPAPVQPPAAPTQAPTEF